MSFEGAVRYRPPLSSLIDGQPTIMIQEDEVNATRRRI